MANIQDMVVRKPATDFDNSNHTSARSISRSVMTKPMSLLFSGLNKAQRIAE